MFDLILYIVSKTSNFKEKSAYKIDIILRKIIEIIINFKI